MTNPYEEKAREQREQLAIALWELRSAPAIRNWELTPDWIKDYHYHQADTLLPLLADFGAACAREARLEALEQAASICDFAARGTIEEMSEGGRSETWKIIAENSVEQYHSIARNIRRLGEQAAGAGRAEGQG